MVLVDEGSHSRNPSRMTSTAAAANATATGAAAEAEGAPLEKGPSGTVPAGQPRGPRASGLGRLFSKIGIGGESVAPEVRFIEWSSACVVPEPTCFVLNSLMDIHMNATFLLQSAARTYASTDVLCGSELGWPSCLVFIGVQYEQRLCRQGAGFHLWVSLLPQRPLDVKSSGP